MLIMNCSTVALKKHTSLIERAKQIQCAAFKKNVERKVKKWSGWGGRLWLSMLALAIFSAGFNGLPITALKQEKQSSCKLLHALTSWNLEAEKQHSPPWLRLRDNEARDSR